MPHSPQPEPRRADPGDAPQLVELREVMLRSMGRPVDGDAAWKTAAQDWFAERLSHMDRFAAFVVDGDRNALPAGRLICAAVGMLHEHAPGPGNLSGLHGHVSNVVTVPEHRRRGHGRAVLTRLLDWFDSETSAPVVDLIATADGRAIYGALGFGEPGGVALRRHRG